MMDTSEMKTVRGWCLRTDREVEITYPKYVMGGLYSCPECGPIRETVSELQHVVGPSGPLLERLRRTPPPPDTAADAGPRAELGRELIAWAADEKWVVREGEGGGRYCIFDCLYHPEDGHGSHCPHLRARAGEAGE